MSNYFVKITAACPPTRAGEFDANLEKAKSEIAKASLEGAHIIVFAQNYLGGANAGSFLEHPSFLNNAEQALCQLAKFTKERDIIVVIGCPLRVNERVFSAAAIIGKGKILGISVNNAGSIGAREIFVGAYQAAFGENLLYKDRDTCFSVILGEVGLGELLRLEEAGAQIIINPSSSAAFIDSSENKIQAARQLRHSAYVYVSDLSPRKEGVGSGIRVISEAGKILAADEGDTTLSTSADVDADFIRFISSRKKKQGESSFYEIAAPIERSGFKLTREFNPLPFVPKNPKAFDRIFDIVCRAVYLRMSNARQQRLIFGLSGGLDSTMTALFLHRMCQKYNVLTKNIIAVTMPSEFSSQRTQANAKSLAQLLGFELINIPIQEGYKTMLKLIGHQEKDDITSENAQARLRTQILLNLANQRSGLVISTGDLSENALGWSTYGGDQFGMFNTNGSLSKTLIQALVEHCARSNEQLRQTLNDVLATPISPELKDGQITEDSVGSYEINDFLIYHMLFRGASAQKAVFLAQTVFNKSKGELAEYASRLAKRFFNNRFKLNASCDTVCISENDLTLLTVPSDMSGEFLD